MAQNLMVGHQLGTKLVKALGLGEGISRIVIDCPADGVVKVYVQRFLMEEQVPSMLEALETAAKTCDLPQIIEAKQIDIDEKGQVKAE